jgi:hypothetical protein
MDLKHLPGLLIAGSMVAGTFFAASGPSRVPEANAHVRRPAGMVANINPACGPNSIPVAAKTLICDFGRVAEVQIYEGHPVRGMKFGAEPQVCMDRECFKISDARVPAEMAQIVHSWNVCMNDPKKVQDPDCFQRPGPSF